MYIYVLNVLQNKGNYGSLTYASLMQKKRINYLKVLCFLYGNFFSFDAFFVYIPIWKLNGSFNIIYYELYLNLAKFEGLAFVMAKMICI